MTDLPAPPVPEACSMAGNDWYPLHFDRLRKSRWWRRASDMARARNVMLWGEAYKAVPAGGLDDDDDDLAESAGFGMDVESFLAVKAEIMAPWTLCADGRWYHPTICEVVLEAWERASEKRKKAAIKKAEQRAKSRGRGGKSAPVPREIQTVPAESENVPGDTEENSRDKTTHAGATSTGQDNTGQEKTEPPNPPSGGWSDLDFEKFWKAYPVQCRSTIAKPRVRGLYGEAIDSGGTVAQLLDGATAADALAKAGGKPLRIDRWLERGIWANHEAPTATDQPATWPGPPEVWGLAVERKGEPWAAGYVGRCAWRDGALVTPSPTIAKAIRAEIGRELDALGYRLLQGVAA